jgi:hypothetical protein
MVLYNSSGNFFHGFHEQDTGLVRPYGLAMIQASDPGTASNSLWPDYNAIARRPTIVIKW